jgi:hypothetical protein
MRRVKWTRQVVRLREKLGKRRVAHLDSFCREGQLSIRSSFFGFNSRFVGAGPQLRSRERMDALPQSLPVINGDLSGILSLTGCKNGQEGIRGGTGDLKLASLHIGIRSVACRCRRFHLGAT